MASPQSGGHGERFPLEEGKSFEDVAQCALCSSKERRERFRQEPFSVVECTECGLVYVTPRLGAESLKGVYDREYWESSCPSWHGYSDYVGDASLYLKTFGMRMDYLQPFLPRSGRALDVGCAAGFFLEVLRMRGWEADGVEPSRSIGEHARRQEGHVHLGTLDDAPFRAGSFDLVTLWDVVEHVADPVKLLRQATSFLKDDGRLVLETQNVSSLAARVLGRRWHHYKHLEHLYHFSPRTLERLLRAAGLEPTLTTWRAAGKYVSGAFVRERATRLHSAMKTVLRPFSGLDRCHLYVNPGDELIVVARKAGIGEPG